MEDSKQEKSDNPKVEKIESKGVQVEKTTWPDGRERVVVLDGKKKVKSNPK